jgi:hypothetical protein
MTKFGAAAVLMPILYKLNGNKIIKNIEKFPILNTTLINSEAWWNNLNWEKKVDAGCIAIHYNKISANYKWNCNNTLYNDLTKSQKKIIDFIFSKKEDNYYKFDLISLLKL